MEEKILKRKGFTLTEALLSLMIIGVIAAFTLPSLFQLIQDKDRQVAYNKSVAVLSEAVQLLKSKEIPECQDIDSNEDLASCFIPVYIRGTQRQNNIDVNDGTVYSFFWRKGEHGTFQDCGEFHGNEENDWNGLNSNCIVTIDIDGKHKNSLRPDDLTEKTKINPPSGKDLFPMAITSHSVRPFFFEGSLGYKYSFGTTPSDENKPWEQNEPPAVVNP